jgi:D-glycero-alpha-D-manno-heptose-7-phosphate kinase
MIISKTPYRVSFSGGGTDLPAFYKHEYGAVVSCSIQKYITVTIKLNDDRRWKITTPEGSWQSKNVDGIKHGIIRECLKASGITGHPLDILVESDLPIGCGMGGSGSLSVGMLRVLYAFQGLGQPSKDSIAKMAAHVEMIRLAKPVGKQDQYAAAHGGLNYLKFNPDNSVDIIDLSPWEVDLKQLESYCLLFFTGATRDAEKILREQSARTPHHLMGQLKRMRNIADEMFTLLRKSDTIREFAHLLDETWWTKRSLGCGITSNRIDHWYSRATHVGAMGGKLLGAGGNGFMLFVAEPQYHDRIRHELDHPMEIPFKIDWYGSEIVNLGPSELDIFLAESESE